MKLAPGSFPWLIRHEMRLAWREVASLVTFARPRLMIPLALLGVAIIHVLAVPLVNVLDPYLHGRGVSISALTTIIGATFTWMMAQGVFGLTRTLYNRTDLDLLLGSPLDAARIVAAKVMAIAVASLGSVSLLLVPVANTGAFLDGPHWLAVYPVLISLALLATALGLTVVVTLFFLIGPRRARLWSHFTAAGIAGIFVLGAQIVAMLPEHIRGNITSTVDAAIYHRSGAFGGFLGFIVAAAQADPFASVMLVVLAILIFALSVVGLGGRFAAANLAASGVEAGGAHHEARPPRAFRSGIARTLRMKEWRLLLRDPNFFAQLAMQIVYTIPIAVVLVRSEMLSLALSLGPTIVMIAAQVSGAIAWITVSGEDAPELIQSAPVSRTAVDAAKLGAVTLPVLAILGLPIAGLAIASPWSALVVLAFAAMAGTSTALINFWHPLPGNRRGMLRRHSQSKFIGLIEHGLAMLWAFAVVFALMGSTVVVGPLGLILLVLGLSRRLGPKLPGSDRNSAAAGACTWLANRHDGRRSLPVENRV